eukprot:gene16420-5012_t
MPQIPVRVFGENLIVEFWDTPGQDRFRGLTRPHYRSSSVVLMVCDLTSGKSLEAIGEDHLVDIEKCCSENTIVMLITNKSDMWQQSRSTHVQQEELEKFAKRHNIHFAYKTCAIKGENVMSAIGSAILH